VGEAGKHAEGGGQGKKKGGGIRGANYSGKGVLNPESTTAVSSPLGFRASKMARMLAPGERKQNLLNIGRQGNKKLYAYASKNAKMQTNVSLKRQAISTASPYKCRGEVERNK